MFKQILTVFMATVYAFEQSQIYVPQSQHNKKHVIYYHIDLNKVT